MSAGASGARRLGFGEVVVVILLGTIAVTGGTGGRLFVLGLVLVALLARVYRPVGPHTIRSRPHLVGTVVAAIGVGAFLFGRGEVLALSIVACAIDVIVGRWLLARVRFGASTERHAVVGDQVAVELRARGVRGPIQARLLDPAGALVRIEADGSGTVPHVASHRGVYAYLRVEVVTVGWLSTMTTTRTDLVKLDTPIAISPRPVAVASTIVPMVADDLMGGALARRGQEAQEVRSLRPYVPGDPRRRVHWPTTARRGELAVVEVDGEVRRSVHLTVELPGLPCRIDHAGPHPDHLDAVAGQARQTVERLLAAGVPVVLTTLESDPEGRPTTVTAPIRSGTELGYRLAAARGGQPASELPTWVIGPRIGPAVLREREDETTETAEPACCDLHGPPCRTARSEHELLPVSRAARERVRSLVTTGTLVGIFAVYALHEAGLPGPPHLALALTVLAIVAASYAWRSLVAPAQLMGSALFLAVVAATLVRVDDGDAAWLVLVAAWVLPRLLGLEILARLEPPSGDSDIRTSWARLGGVVAGILIGVGVAAATGHLVVGAAVGTTASAGAVVAWDRPWWRHGVDSLALASLLAATTVVAPFGAVVLAVVAIIAMLVVRADEQRAIPALDGGRASLALGSLVARVVIVCSVLVLVLPLVQWGREASADVTSRVSASGGGRSGAWLGEHETLDLTAPRGSGDRVMLTVDADLPALLRGQSLELWDGRTWSGPIPEIERSMNGPGMFEQVRFAPSSVHSNDGPLPLGSSAIGDAVENRQHITVHAPGAWVLPAASQPVEVRANSSVARLVDGNLRASPPLGPGDTYTVVSRMPTPSVAQLRSSSSESIPADIRHRYTQPPGLSVRATTDIRAATADAATAYDQVAALEAWLGEQVSYSLDAPLPPAGVDVVDHFLYEAGEGWCQQIATAMTLGLRELGIPARLVTGYTASEWNGRHFVVRERHAHAWVEVYFAEIGWHAVDPTRVVPLADEATPPQRTENGTDPVVLSVALGVLAVAGVGWLLWRRRHERDAGGRARSEPDPRPWASATDRRIRDLGERCGVERADGEGVREHADRLAIYLADDRLRQVAMAVARDAYDREALGRSERHRTDSLLDEVMIRAASLAAAGTSDGSVVARPPAPGRSPR